MVTMMIPRPKPSPWSLAKYLMASAIGAPIVFQINPVGCPVALSTWTQPVKTNSIAIPIAEMAKRFNNFTIFYSLSKNYTFLFYCFFRKYTIVLET